jgi:transposase
MGQFLSIRALHEEGVANKAIARRLEIDVRTVRKYVRRIERGAREPRRAKVTSKLERFEGKIAAKVEQGLSAVQIYQDLCGKPGFAASYETVKRRVCPADAMAQKGSDIARLGTQGLSWEAT